MDIYRKIGIGIVMFIPAFVGSGLVWAVFHGLIAAAAWIGVVVWLAVMGYVYKNIVCQNTSHA